jgi:hypothetical protein
MVFAGEVVTGSFRVDAIPEELALRVARVAAAAVVVLFE